MIENLIIRIFNIPFSVIAATITVALMIKLYTQDGDRDAERYADFALDFLEDFEMRIGYFKWVINILVYMWLILIIF